MENIDNFKFIPFPTSPGNILQRLENANALKNYRFRSLWNSAVKCANGSIKILSI